MIIYTKISKLFLLGTDGLSSPSKVSVIQFLLLHQIWKVNNCKHFV
jgi:hypothetical protein